MANTGARNTVWNRWTALAHILRTVGILGVVMVPIILHFGYFYGLFGPHPLESFRLSAQIILSESVLTAIAVWVLAARIRHLGAVDGRGWKVASAVLVGIALIEYVMCMFWLY